MKHRSTSPLVALLLAVLLGLAAVVAAQLLVRSAGAAPPAPLVRGPAGASYATWWLVEPGNCADLDLAAFVVRGGRADASCGDYAGQRVIVLRVYGVVFSASWRGVLIEQRVALPLIRRAEGAAVTL